MTRKRRKRLVGMLIAAALLAVLVFRVKMSWFPAAEERPYRFVAAWGTTGRDPGEFREPIGIAVAGNEVFVSDAGNHRIQVFDRGGHFLREFGHEGDGVGKLDRPVHLEVRGDRLHVADYLNDRIQSFRLSGEPVATVGSPGSGPGEFDAPAGGGGRRLPPSRPCRPPRRTPPTGGARVRRRGNRSTAGTPGRRSYVPGCESGSR